MGMITVFWDVRPYNLIHSHSNDIFEEPVLSFTRTPLFFLLPSRFTSYRIFSHISLSTLPKPKVRAQVNSREIRDGRQTLEFLQVSFTNCHSIINPYSPTIAF
jgi:hypothetical protein